MDAFAELSQKSDRIQVNFKYSPGAVDAIKGIPGAKFVSREKGGPHWMLPLDLTSARMLRERFGNGLKLGAAIREWGRESVAKSEQLRELSTADDIPFGQLAIDKKLPKLAKWLRPYQRADIKFLATTNTLNLLEQRLGKTTEIIGAVYEAGLEFGPHLVIAPQKSLDSVWRYEIERWTKGDVYTYSGTAKADMDSFFESLADGVPVWWVTTADMIRRGQYPVDVLTWNTITVDEYHKTGLAEIKNVFSKAVNKIKAKRKWAMSGTPMGGKPLKLWGGLHFLEPQQFTSKWRWAETWLEVKKEAIYVRGGAKRMTYEVGGIQEGVENAFYAALAPHAVRRLRSEVLPQLPPKQRISVWCDMTTKQRKQYEQFAANAEIRIEEQYLSASSVLAEFTRLKQFANAYSEVEVLGYDEEDNPKYKIRATPESGKLPYLLERLAEAGIDPEDPAGDTQAIVASQFRDTIEMVSSYLTEKGIPNIRITGKVSKAESERAQRAFKADADHEGLRVCCMVTTIGVGITLDNVESVHLLDETWNPDDQEQLSDRAINTSRLHQVNVLTYRSRDTIEERIHGVTLEKAFTNRNVLDLLRQVYKSKPRKGGGCTTSLSGSV